MTKKSNRIIKITTVLLALLLLGIAAAPASADVLFNVTLDGVNTTTSLTGGSTVALNFTIQDTANTTGFYNISLFGFTIPLGVNTTSKTNITVTNKTDIIGNFSGINGTVGVWNVVNLSGTGAFVNVSFNTTSSGPTSGSTPLGNLTTSGKQAYINITNLTVPIITNNTLNTIFINLTVGNVTNNGTVLKTITLTVLDVNATNSNILNASVFKVANNSDIFFMNLTAKDANNNSISGATFTISSNRTQDNFPNGTTVTTNDTGQAKFNISSTLTGLARITANGTNLGLANFTSDVRPGVVFIPGPASKLAIFGPDSVTGITILNQTIAVQDINGNNVTSDALPAFGTPPYLLQASITSGTASITSTNPIPVIALNASNVTNLTVFAYNYTATYERVNFSVTAAVGAGAVTLQVTSNATLTGTSKTLTFYGSIASLNVTLNKTSMNANNGNDTILVTAKLKDAPLGTGNDIKTSGVTISLNSLTPTLFNTANISATNTTDANGIATFNVRSSTISGSGTIGATVTINPAGGTGQTGTSPTVTLSQAPSIANSVVVNSTNGAILTGANSTITATINDYNSTGGAISGYSVRFNITTGDATFANNGLTVYTATTASTGNATANITSTNASTNISVNVTIVDENVQTKPIAGAPQNFTVTPNVASQFSITPSTSVGMTNVLSTVQQFTIRTKDSVGNFNLTAGGTINITTNNQVLGNMSNSTTSGVLNNLSIAITSGNATFNYTVNDTTVGTAVLTLNSSLGINGTITITTSAAQGIALTLNKTVQNVGSAVLASAQLTDISGNALGISNTNISFVVKNATNVIQSVSTNATNASGIATFNVTQSVAGVYTVTASNGTLSNSTTVTFAGPAASIVVTANNTSPQVNQTVTINATAKDANGVTSGSLDTGTMSFLANGTSFASATITSGVASTTYTQATAGTVTITAFYNSTLQGSTTVTFGAATVPVLTTITVTPSTATVASGSTQTFTATGYDQNNNTITITPAAVWSSSNTTVGTINATTGVFTASKVGTATITATNGTNGTVNGTATVTVTAGALSTITVSPATATVLVNATQTFAASGADAAGNAVSITPAWSVSNASVGTISATTGVFTAAAAGTTLVNATNQSVTGSATVSVVTVIVNGAIAGTVTNASSGLPLQGATVTAANATFSTSTATNATGYYTITNLYPGTYTVTASLTGYNLSSASVIVTSGATVTQNFALTPAVGPTLQSIDILPTSETVTVNQTKQFIATGRYTDTSTLNLTNVVTWTSSSPSVADFVAGQPGNLKASGNGTTQVTASYLGITSSAAPVLSNPNGDVTANGAVDSIDVMFVAQYVAGTRLSLPNNEAGDVASPCNGLVVVGGNVDSIDVMFLAQYVAGTRQSLGNACSSPVYPG